VRVSHLRTYQEARVARETAEADNTKKAIKKVNSTVEKTTLGDISALAALKDKLEKGE
jgi:small subunit ribosomal protein S1